MILFRILDNYSLLLELSRREFIITPISRVVLKDNEYTYQIFVEPKGAHLLLNDKWKEQFMLSLNERDDIEVLAEDENVRLMGLCLY